MTTSPRFRVLIVLLCLFGFSALPAVAQFEQLTKPSASIEKAVKLQKAGKLDEALKEFIAIKKADPTNVGAIVQIGIIRATKGDMPGAESAFKEALALSPKDYGLLMNLARITVGRDKNEEAASYAARAAIVKPKEIDPRMIGGVANIKLKRYDAAISCFKAGLSIKPGDKGIRYNLAYAYMNAERYSEASTQLDQMIKSDPKVGQLRMMAGYVSEKSGNKQAAIKHYEAATNDKMTSLPALMNLARLYSELKQPQKAQAIFARVLKKDPKNPQANLAIGQVLFQKGDYKKAKKYFDTARAADPKNIMTNMSLAMIGIRTKDLGLVSKRAGDVLAVDPNNRQAIEFAAYVHENKSRFDEALALYRRWEKAYPKDSAPNHKMGLVYQYRNDSAASMAQFEKGIAKDPKDNALLTSYAMALKFSSNFAKANEVYGKILAIKPGDPDASIGSAECLKKLEKPDDAVAVLNKAIAANPKNENLNLTLARSFVDQKKPDQAIEQYKKILVFSADNVSAQMGLASVYDEQKDYQSEIDIYRKLAEKNAKNPGFAVNVVRIYEKWEKLDEAIAEADKLVKASPDELAYRSVLGELLDKKGDNVGALAQYTEMAKNKDERAKGYAYEKSGEIYQKMLKPDEAIASYKDALKIQAGNTRALDALAKIYDEQKKTDEFDAYLKELLTPGSDDLPYQFFFDRLSKAGKADEATKVLEEISAKKKDNINVMLALGAAYSQSGKMTEAAAQFKKYLAKNPENPFVVRRLAQVYKTAGQYPQALEQYDKAGKVFSNDPGFLNELAGTYEAAGMTEDAIRTYNSYLALKPDDEVAKKKVETLGGKVGASIDPFSGAPPAPK